MSLALGALWPASSQGAIALLQPQRVVDGTRPLTLTLLVSADMADQRANQSFRVPDTLDVTASAPPQPPISLTMRRNTPGPATIQLSRGEYRMIEYSAEIPPELRGEVRLDAVGIDAAPVLITLNRAPTTAGIPATPPTSSGEATPPALSAVSAKSAAVVQPDLNDEGRLTFNEPMYVLVGAHDGGNVKFQLSFKFRIFEGENPDSKGLLQNLYLGYTQLSLWDLSQQSRPLRDTNYRPSLFYYLADTGFSSRAITRLSLATGFEHESNGREGADSRSVTTVFVKPTFYLGELTDWHWTVMPKLYFYLGKSENPHIAQYRGYMDLKLAYGKADSWEFAATLRKGTRSWYGSADAQVTYPLARLIPGTAGYLMAGYFVGYGESLLDYNHKLPWQFRLGYALSR